LKTLLNLIPLRSFKYKEYFPDSFISNSIVKISWAGFGDTFTSKYEPPEVN